MFGNNCSRPCSNQGNGNAISGIDRVIHVEGIDLELKVAYGDSCPLYADCQQVRSEAGDEVLSHAFDARSYHFVLYYQGRPVGTMTATRCDAGSVDQEQFYPQAFLKAYRRVAFSSCKLRINHYEKRGPGIFRIVTRAAWAFLVSENLRIDIINCDLSKRSAYESLGYPQNKSAGYRLSRNN